MKTIVTIQHTQSQHHTNGMVGSWTDWDLTEEGLRQAERIALHIREKYGDKAAVLYTSDLRRAAHTAEIVGEALGCRPVPRQELRERNLGQACGQSVQWLRANLQPEHTVDDRMFPDAESRRDEWQRLAPFFDEVMNSADETVIIVAHGDLLSVWNTMFLGLPAETLERCELYGQSGGVSVMQVMDGGKRFIRKMSDTAWMQP